MKKILNIFGDISSEKYLDEDITPSFISDEIKGLTNSDELEININSFGGEVFAAVAIANLIAGNPAQKTFNIIGICASAATMLFSATDKVNVSNGAMVMYHKPLTCSCGNSIDFRKTADILDKIENENIIKNLIARTKKPVGELSELIKNEWWLTSDEAISNLGFIACNSQAIENKAKTKQENIYKNYMEKKKALKSNALYDSFINIKNSLK